MVGVVGVARDAYCVGDKLSVRLSDYRDKSTIVYRYTEVPAGVASAA